MGLLVFLLILLLLAVAGILGLVVKIALGVALGMVAAVLMIAWLVRRRIRRFLYGASRRPPIGPNAPRWRQIPGSRVEVLDEHAEPHQTGRGDSGRDARS
jgi:ABC-type nickel/cobalt efflux system permease component RcnA